MLWGCNPANEKAESQCSCPIPESVDKKTEKEQDSSDQTWRVGASGDVEAIVKKAVDAKISVSGSYSNSNSKIEEVYREIIGSNPKITQKANLYRSIACAYYEIICKDKTLNDKDKTNKLSEAVAGYEKNINKIINEEEPIRTDTQPTLVYPKPKKEEQQMLSKQNKYRNIIYKDIEIMFPSRFKNCKIYVDGKEAKILDRSTTKAIIQVIKSNKNSRIEIVDEGKIVCKTEIALETLKVITPCSN